MSRHNQNARRSFDSRMTFKELCRLIDVSPYQRTLIIRFLKREEREVIHMEEVTTALAAVQNALGELTTAIGNVQAAPAVPAVGPDETITGTTALGTPVVVTVVADQPAVEPTV